MDNSKWCNDCKSSLSLDLFYKDKNSPDGRDYYCISCRKQRKKSKSQTLYQERYRAENKEKRQLYDRSWRTLNKGKTRLYSANYRAAKLQATPEWLSDIQKKEIEYMYSLAKDCEALSGNQYHVDHIIPLQGKGICGLHVPWNLQVLPAEQNLKKHNNYNKRLDVVYLGVANG